MKISSISKKIFLFLFFFSGLQTVFAQIENSAYVPDGYLLVFNDEFDNPRGKFVNWKPDNRDGRGDEWKSYATIENGVMKLKNLKLETPTASGRLFTAPSCSGIRYYKYGYFECRYKYAASTGFNNSFWMLGAPQMSKDYIEIDINEGQLDEGGRRNLASWLAAGAQPSWDQVRPMTLDHTRGGCTRPAYHYFDMDLSADFHTYGFLWTPDTLSYYFDGKLLLKHPNKRIYSNEPQYRLLNYPMNIYLSTLGSSGIFGYENAVESSMDIDYVRVYQLPGSTDGTPPSGGTNLLKNSGFGPYDDEDYGGGMYSWNSGVGNIDSAFYSSTVTEARTSPLYMPNQNINVLPAGDYNLTFRARVFDATANTASLRMKISNSDNLSTSIISKLTCTSGDGGVSGSEIVITKAHAPVFKNFTYRFTVATTSTTASYTRVMFYQNNTAGAATFQLDDVVLTSLTPTAVNEVRSGFKVSGGKGKISFMGDLSEPDIAVYSLTGVPVKLVSEIHSKDISIEKGIYLVKVKNGNESFSTSKVVVF